MAKLPPTPVGVPPGHSYWNDWYEKLRDLIDNAVQSFNDLDFAGSNLTSIVTRNHNDLQNFQGGTSNEYYHLTNSQHTALSSLANYSTNTFTPTIVGTSTAGVGTYSVQQGKYTRYGDLVFVHIRLTWSAHTGTGNMNIGGLPFTPAANATCQLAGRDSNITYSGTKLAYTTNPGTTEIIITTDASGTTSTSIPIDTAGSIFVSGVYFV